MHLEKYVYANPSRVAEASQEYRRVRTSTRQWALFGVGVFAVSAIYAYAFGLRWLQQAMGSATAIEPLVWLFVACVALGVGTWWAGTITAERRWRRILDEGVLARDARTLFDTYAPHGPRPDSATVWEALIAEDDVIALRRQCTSLLRAVSGPDDDPSVRSAFVALAVAEEQQRRRFEA